MRSLTKLNPRQGIAIIGLGNWGSSLAHALLEAGLPVREIIHSSVRRVNDAEASGARGLAVHAGHLPVTTLHRARLDASIIWLCVPDSAIAQVARRIVERVAGRRSQLRGQVVVHSSGALGAEILGVAARAGAEIASAHPLMSFPNRNPVRLDGVPFAVQGNPAACRRLSGIIRQLSGRPFSIRSDKALYHAMSTLASPLLAAHLAAAEQMATLCGLTSPQARVLLRPIVLATLNNVFLHGARGSFSGPIARGDVRTVDLHLRALKEHPMLADLYRSLALYALDVLPASRKKELRRLLRQPS